MASLINAVRSLTGDKTWIIKFAAAAYLIFYECEYLPKSVDDPVKLILIYIVTGLFLFGCAVSIMHRNITNSVPLLPGIFSVPEIASGSVCGLIAAAPGIAACAVLFYFLQFLKLDDVSMNIIYVLSVFLIVPFIAVPIVLYAARKHLADAFRYDIINNASGNVIMASILFAIQYALIFGIGSAVLYYFLVQMFSAEHISIKLLFYVIGCASFYVLMTYFSDMYDDHIQSLEQKDDDASFINRDSL